MISRRRFLQLGLASAGAAAGVGLYTWRIEPHWLELVERDLPIAGLPTALEGKLLAQLSDLHVGPRVDPAYIASTFLRVAERSPDITVVTGDWISYRDASVFEELRAVLRGFPHGRLASLGILGNHDYGVRWRMPSVADAVVQETASVGITMLRHAAVDVQGLRIVGLEDFWGPNFSLAPELFAAGGSAPQLALCHNPDVADHATWGAHRGWILSGHTQGGQCKPPFLPPPLLPVKNQRYTAGEIPLEDGRRLYISRGVGHLIRVRFNVRPEATLFRLRSE